MLSKSRYLAGLQCPLRLWHQCYNPELASAISPAQQAIIATGQKVGMLATSLYPGGTLVKEDHLHHTEAEQATMAAIADPSVKAIFEAAFSHDGVRIRADILERHRNGGWNLIEVKSASSVKDVYLTDVAVQVYVMRGSGLIVSRAGILHLNNKYLYDGDHLELERLYSFSDLTEEALLLQQEFPSKVAELKEMLLKASPPQVLPSRHCMSPYECQFWKHCTAEMPEFWIMGLTGIREERLHDLAALGVEDIRDIPSRFPLTELQERIKTCVITREEYIAPELDAELTDVEYPIHFLDFETVSQAIPRYPRTRPYQVIPFQWSDHSLSENGELAHSSFIFKEDADPREDFAATLLEALGDKGTIFTYSSYENRVVGELARHLPQHSDMLFATLDRFKDMQTLIKRYFYNHGFHGSFSLKSVLPVLVPGMSYDGLVIQEGAHASQEYLRMIDPETSLEEKEEIEEDLLAYCNHDTLAMVKIREQLLRRF